MASNNTLKSPPSGLDPSGLPIPASVEPEKEEKKKKRLPLAPPAALAVSDILEEPPTPSVAIIEDPPPHIAGLDSGDKPPLVISPVPTKADIVTLGADDIEEGFDRAFDIPTTTIPEESFDLLPEPKPSPAFKTVEARIEEIKESADIPSPSTTYELLGEEIVSRPLTSQDKDLERDIQLYEDDRKVLEEESRSLEDETYKLTADSFLLERDTKDRIDKTIAPLFPSEDFASRMSSYTDSANVFKSNVESDVDRINSAVSALDVDIEKWNNVNNDISALSKSLDRDIDTLDDQGKAIDSARENLDLYNESEVDLFNLRLDRFNQFLEHVNDRTNDLNELSYENELTASVLDSRADKIYELSEALDNIRSKDRIKLSLEGQVLESEMDAFGQSGVSLDAARKVIDIETDKAARIIELKEKDLIERIAQHQDKIDSLTGRMDDLSFRQDVMYGSDDPRFPGQRGISYEPKVSITEDTLIDASRVMDELTQSEMSELINIYHDYKDRYIGIDYERERDFLYAPYENAKEMEQLALEHDIVLPAALVDNDVIAAKNQVLMGSPYYRALPNSSKRSIIRNEIIKDYEKQLRMKAGQRDTRDFFEALVMVAPIGRTFKTVATVIKLPAPVAKIAATRLVGASNISKMKSGYYSTLRNIGKGVEGVRDPAGGYVSRVARFSDDPFMSPETDIAVALPGSVLSALRDSVYLAKASLSTTKNLIKSSPSYSRTLPSSLSRYVKKKVGERADDPTSFLSISKKKLSNIRNSTSVEAVVGPIGHIAESTLVPSVSAGKDILAAGAALTKGYVAPIGYMYAKEVIVPTVKESVVKPAMYTKEFASFAKSGVRKATDAPLEAVFKLRDVTIGPPPGVQEISEVSKGLVKDLPSTGVVATVKETVLETSKPLREQIAILLGSEERARRVTARTLEEGTSPLPKVGEKATDYYKDVMLVRATGESGRKGLPSEKVLTEYDPREGIRFYDTVRPRKLTKEQMAEQIVLSGGMRPVAGGIGGTVTRTTTPIVTDRRIWFLVDTVKRAQARGIKPEDIANLPTLAPFIESIDSILEDYRDLQQSVVSDYNEIVTSLSYGVEAKSNVIDALEIKLEKLEEIKPRMDELLENRQILGKVEFRKTGNLSFTQAPERDLSTSIKLISSNLKTIPVEPAVSPYVIPITPEKAPSPDKPTPTGVPFPTPAPFPQPIPEVTPVSPAFEELPLEAVRLQQFTGYQQDPFAFTTPFYMPRPEAIQKVTPRPQIRPQEFPRPTPRVQRQRIRPRTEKKTRIRALPLLPFGTDSKKSKKRRKRSYAESAMETGEASRRLGIYLPEIVVGSPFDPVFVEKKMVSKTRRTTFRAPVRVKPKVVMI